MKGYCFPKENPHHEPVEEMTLVGCKNCRTTWMEPRIHTCGIRINGPTLDYDACERCYDIKTNAFREDFPTTTRVVIPTY